jgi:hypothetical protein
MNKMSKLGLCHQLNAKFDGLGRIKPRYRGYFSLSSAAAVDWQLKSFVSQTLPVSSRHQLASTNHRLLDV